MNAILNIDFCDEAYVIEERIEVVVKILGESQNIRIEALRSLANGAYSTHAYIKKNLTVQPTYPQTGNKFDKNPEDVQVWIDFNLPWTNRSSANAALNQALGFLSEQCSS